MSEHARNMDTFMDGDDGPDWWPGIGERVEVEHSAIAYSGVPNERRYLAGKIVHVDQEPEEAEFTVEMDYVPPGRIGRYVYAALEEIKPEGDE